MYLGVYETLGHSPQGRNALRGMRYLAPRVIVYGREAEGWTGGNGYGTLHFCCLLWSPEHEHQSISIGS